MGDNGPDAALAARSRLEHLLASRVATLDRHYRLSRLQKQKLKLAGQGDIRRLEDEIARQREKFVATRFAGVDADIRAAFGEATTLRQALKSGPFGKASLFAKALNTLLEPDQLANSERRRQLAAKSTVKITLDNAATLETAAKLQEEAYQIGWTHRENEIALLPFGKAVEIRSADKLEPLRTVGERHKLVNFDFSRDGNFVALTDNSTKASCSTWRPATKSLSTPSPGSRGRASARTANWWPPAATDSGPPSGRPTPASGFATSQSASNPEA